MATKSRVLFLLKLLQQKSDENQPLTTAQVRKALAAEGYPASIKTIRDDIETLKESGYDIVVNESSGLTTTYSYVDRELEVPELQILIDAVASSQLITKEKSRMLIKKLASMAGPTSREDLQPRVLVSENIKAQNAQILFILQKIREGIKNNRKISFKYYNYNLKKERVPRHDGEIYVISPYATVWKDDRYYLVGYSDKRNKVVPFRIDRMETPSLTKQVRVPAPADFNIRNYSEKITKMFDGPEEEIILRCKNETIDQIIDKFGKDVEVITVDEEHFEVRETAAISGTFFGWLFQYVGDIELVSPANVLKEYVARTKAVAENKR